MRVANVFDIISSLIVIAIVAKILSDTKTAPDIEYIGALFSEALTTAGKS